MVAPLRSEKLGLRAATVLVVAAVGTLSSSCGGPSGGTCPLENWSGACALSSFVRTQDIEFPVPHSVFEAIYTPVPQPNSPNYTPPDVRVLVKALGKYEAQVQAHVAAHQQVACEQTIKPGCAYNPVVAHLPPFAPNESLVEDTGPYGCERIEQYGLNTGPTAGNQGSETLPLLFQFELNVSTPDQSMASIAQAAAQRLQNDASIECLAVVGQAAAGETPGIGDLRAENVKRLLTQYGAPVSRLMTVASAVPLFSAGSERPLPKVEDRRVLLKIVLRKGQ